MRLVCVRTVLRGYSNPLTGHNERIKSKKWIKQQNYEIYLSLSTSENRLGQDT